MENTSGGCVRNHDEKFKTVSKFIIDGVKAKHANPYVNKPIFRRKLIEKYSTARYNINTKRVLVKIPPSCLPWENNEVHESPHENNPQTGNAENSSSASSKVDSASTTCTSRRLINKDGDKTLNSSSLTIPNQSHSACGTKQNYSPSAKKRKLDSTSPSSACNGTWKIAPKSIYNHLLDMCQSTVEVKSEEVKKETGKKRKICHWTKRRNRKKPSWCQKPKEDRSYFDPYVECLKEAENHAVSTSAGTGCQKLGIVMYLGVNRPMFPLVYRNLRVLNDSNDEKITDFWAEFALSTLITKPDDKKCKPVLVPIKDPELATLVSECVEATIVQSKMSVVLNATTTSVSEAESTTLSEVTPRTCSKREEIHFLKNDCKPEVRPLRNEAKPYKLRNKKSRKMVKTNKAKSDSKAEKEERELNKSVKRNESNLGTSNEENERKFKMEENERKSKAEEEAERSLMLEEIKRKLKTEEFDRQSEVEDIERNVKIEEIKRKSKILETELKSKFEENEHKSKVEVNVRFSKVEESRRKPTSKFLEYQADKIVRNKRPYAGPKSKSRNRPTTGVIRPKEDEKSILKRFGYKECFVAVPKLSDTLIKYLSSGNYSNQSAELSDPTERELIEDTDDFGLIQCTRTDGIIIDYVKRNRSSVYYYKLKKMLDFQKTNNKYFVCCDYILIDRTAESDRDIDIESIEEDDEDDKQDVKPFSAPTVRSSRNPNDLFKVSKLSEFKNKSNNICWVKNHDLKLRADVKWLLISLDKYVASLSHVSGCVLRYRLLFEIIYRAELSKKVICCEITKLPEGSDHKLAFGVYAFPGLCDKLLVGPYSYHEHHELSAFVRTSTGSSERASIRTLEEKENFPQLEDLFLPVKHINAKWWSGKRSSDLTEQYLNFYFNPSVVKCVQSTDKINLTKLMDDHPCNNYHSYQITGRESNLVLFHDRTNAIEKSAVVTAPKISTTFDVVNNVENVTEDPPPTAPSKQSRNLRKKPRMDYSQLVTDDMALPFRARSRNSKNWNFHIVEVKSLRKRGGPRPPKTEPKAKTKRSRYHEAPQQHIMNERLRRLEFRNRRNNLASVLEARSTGSNNTQSLISILQQAKEIIAYLNVDNERLDEEGKRLRSEQSIMMRKFLALLRSLDINSVAYKNGMNFVASWKKIKANHRNKLIEILGQNFDKYKASKAAELARIASASDNRTSNIIHPVQLYGSNFKRVSFDNQSGVEGDKNESRIRDSYLVKDENTAQRMNSRKKKRQKLRDVFRQRNNMLQKNEVEVVECEISEEVIGADGTPLRFGEVPIHVPDVALRSDPCAGDPLANDDDDCHDDAASSFGVRSTEPGREPSHSLYYEHSYSSLDEEPIDLTNESDKRIPVIPIRGGAIRQTEPTFSFLKRNRLNIARNLAGTSLLQRRRQQPLQQQQQQQQQSRRQQRKNPMLSPMSPSLASSVSSSSSSSSRQRRNPILVSGSPILKNSTTSSLQRKYQPIPTSSVSMSASSPGFQIVVRRTANNNLCIDIIDNGKVFARLNIAKVNDGNNPSDATGSTRGSEQGPGATTYTKIMTIIQAFLQQMEKTSPVFPPNEANDDERLKQAKRRHVVNSLRSFISKFENRRKTSDDAGYSSSSRASNSDDTSPPYVAENIDLDDGYSSKSSEASYDRDHDANVGEARAVTEAEVVAAVETVTEVETVAEVVAIAETEAETVTVSNDRLVNGGLAIENIVLDDDSDESQSAEALEGVRQKDDFIAEEEEEEEEEEIVCEEELIEEEEEEILGEGSTLEEMNDVVDAAMRGDEGDRFADAEMPNAEPLTIPTSYDEPIVRRTKTLVLPKPSSKVLYTNQFTIIRSKDKFIPNIMKTPTKIADAASPSKANSDYFSRIQIKPSAGPLVQLSAAANSPQKTTGVDDEKPSSNSNNDSIIKRLWYSPVTRAESNLKILRRESNFNEAGKTSDHQSEREKSTNDDDDSESCEKENSNSETECGADAEQDSCGANRIVIKSFANHNKFQETFLSNVDKLLNPES